jgi:hypothetical protein
MARVLQASDLRCPVTGKHAYPTEADARERLQHVWAHPTPGRSTRDRAWKVYQCPECHWWHHGSKPTRDLGGVHRDY